MKTADALGEIRELALSLGRPPSLREWCEAYQRGKGTPQHWGTTWSELVNDALHGREFAVAELPSETPDAAEILERNKAQFGRVARAREARRLVDVKMKLAGPIAIAHIGDPHLDDPGCHLARLEEHIELIRETEGMYCINVGDSTNNWVGRLAHLYGEQGTTAREAWVLAEWMVERLKDKLLALIGGNHDCWSGAGDPLSWISRQAGSVYEPHGVRLRLRLPGELDVTINARHDFRGHSQWNPTHGIMKAAQMGWRDHILTAGHKHISGIGMVKDPMSGRVTHCVQVPSYKVYDQYADKLGLPDQGVSPCVVTLIDPGRGDEAGLITVFQDPGMGARVLGALRG